MGVIHNAQLLFVDGSCKNIFLLFMKADCLLKTSCSFRTASHLGAKIVESLLTAFAVYVHMSNFLFFTWLKRTFFLFLSLFSIYFLLAFLTHTLML
jgi:hypothetical protein